MTAESLLAAALAFLAVLAAGASLRRRSAARPAPIGADIWREARSEQAARWSVDLSHRLAMAGMERPGAAAWFQAVRIGCAAVAAVVGAWFGLSELDEPRGALFAAALGALLGWRLTTGWLQGRIARRQTEIRADFPVMLDLLQISMQGGMSLHAAWSASSRSLEGGGDALAQEMRRIDLSVGLGRSWGETLAEAADRTGVDDFRSLGSLLGQTQRFGTGIADMIRVLCDSLRHEEVQGLEEQAHRRTVRMLTVLAGMLLPATLLLVIAPLLLMLFDSLKQATSD